MIAREPAISSKINHLPIETINLGKMISEN